MIHSARHGVWWDALRGDVSYILVPVIYTPLRFLVSVQYCTGVPEPK
jgi:hypothetical protein